MFGHGNDSWLVLSSEGALYCAVQKTCNVLLSIRMHRFAIDVAFRYAEIASRFHDVSVGLMLQCRKHWPMTIGGAM